MDHTLARIEIRLLDVDPGRGGWCFCASVRGARQKNEPGVNAGLEPGDERGAESIYSAAAVRLRRDARNRCTPAAAIAHPMSRSDEGSGTECVGCVKVTT